jgi:hypothetical protein
MHSEKKHFPVMHIVVKQNKKLDKSECKSHLPTMQSVKMTEYKTMNSTRKYVRWKGL